ncbi:ATP-binding protein [Patescibacteria group bacterium]|nr:ATP-binding protein [Patescibacteria group bacterium]MBU1015495.1 ATP-binding protein [Patescibacteria group bacterium]MBU1685418.1 ATP-binding protein [Patescibacteria group bacterium]MBU1938379.1 ATP-binding protein [Patescibacteria group bacterium]
MDQNPAPTQGHTAEQSVLSKSNDPTSQEAPLKITIILPTNAYFMAGIRDFTMTITQNMTGFSQQWAYRLQSVVDELTNNAIEFGSAVGENITITFVSEKNKYIEVFVKDTGTGSSKMSAADMMQYLESHKNIDPTTITSIRGRGLSQIVANWADKVEFTDNEDGGLTAHAIKYIDANEQL